MTVWNHVETDFGSDETANFGPRQETGSSLYQVDTIATISPRDKSGVTSEVPRVFSAVSAELACVAANSHFSIFRDFQFVQTLEFDSQIDTLCWSPDDTFLVLANNSGALCVVETTSLNVVWNIVILPPSPEDEDKNRQIFQKIIVKKQEANGNAYDLLILSQKGQICIFTGITAELMAECQSDEGGNIMERLSIKMADASEFHSQVHDMVLLLDNTLILMGAGDCILTSWDYAADQLEVLDAIEALETCDEIIQGKATNDGIFLFLLTGDKHLDLWDARLLCLLPQPKELSTLSIASFQLLRTQDLDINNNCHSLDGLKLVIMTEPVDKRCELRVLSLPEQEWIYSVQLQAYTFLSHCPIYQESLYVVEGCPSEVSSDGLSCLRVRSLTEAQPETRLQRLLSKNRFSEAEIFAKQFNLDCQIVHKCKVNYLLDQLSPWNADEYDDETIEGMKADLWACLTKIKDDLHIASMCIHVALPTLADTQKILEYAKKRLLSLNVKGQNEKEQQEKYLQELSSVQHRLTTFKLVYGRQKYCSKHWDDFQRTALLELAYNWLKKGQVELSFVVWTRHHHEWSGMLTDSLIEQMLSCIADDVPAIQVLSWLTHDLIPYIITCMPNALELTVQWVIDKALNMELLEKELWPQNVLRFLKDVYHICSEMAETSTNSQIFTPAQIINKTHVSIREVIRPLQVLIEKHEHLYLLSSKYNFFMTYDQFAQETIQSVVYRMLDKVMVPELIPGVLNSQVKPYMAEHKMNENVILAKYIQDLVGHFGNIVSYFGETAWEAKACAVIQCINATEPRLDAVFDVAKHASVPWCAGIRDLVTRSLKLTHPKVQHLHEQCRLTEMKEILHKYELKKFSLETDQFSRLMHRIIHKDEPDSLKDCLRILSLKGLTDTHEHDLYMCWLKLLIHKNRLPEAMAYLSSCAVSSGLFYCNQLLQYITYGLNKERKYQTSEAWREEREQMTAAGIKLTDYLIKESIDDLEKMSSEKLNVALNNIRSLQREFSIPILLCDYQCEQSREEVLFNFVKGVPLTDIKDVKYNKMYRLADLLCIPQQQLQGRLALHVASTGLVETTLNLTQVMFENDPSPDTADTMISICQSLLTHGSSVSDLTEHGHQNNVYSLASSIHSIATKACSVCRPETCGACLELCKCTSLMLAVANETECGQYVSSLQGSASTDVDPYNSWTFSSVFREDGLVLTSTEVIPPAAQYTCAHLAMTEHCSCCSIAQSDSSVDDKADDNDDDRLSLTLDEAPPSPLIRFEQTSSELMSILEGSGQCVLAMSCLFQSLNSLIQYLSQQVMTLPFFHTNAADKISKDREEFGDIWPRQSGSVNGLLCTILPKVFACPEIDVNFGLALLLSLPRKTAYEQMMKVIRAAGHDYETLQIVAQVGHILSTLYKDPQKQLALSELIKKASWGHRLGKHQISFREVFYGTSTEMMTLLPEMAQSQSVTMELVKDFCSFLKFNEEEGLLKYLEYLLLQKLPSASDTNASQWRSHQLQRARQTIDNVQMLSLLQKHLVDMIEKVNSYDYELLEFLLEEVLKINSPELPTIKTGLIFLHYLKVYKRKSTPAEYELSYGQNNYAELGVSVDDSPALSSIRLPYHAIMSGDPWKIIKPELDADTVEQWVSIADLHKISKDQICVTAIQNTVTSYIESFGVNGVNNSGDAGLEKGRCSWELTDVSRTMLTRINDMLMMMENCEMATACSGWVVKQLPIGAEKVQALSACVMFSQRWYSTCSAESSDKEKAKKAYLKFQKYYHCLSVEQVLYQHNLSEVDLLQLANQPEALIDRLYKHHTIISDQKNKPDIHSVAEHVAQLYDLDLDKLVSKMMLDWLRPSTNTTQDDPDITVTFNLNELQLDVGDQSVEQEHHAMRRVLYLMSRGDVERNCQLLVHEAVSTSNMCRVKAFTCLLETANESTVHRITNKSNTELRELLSILLYVVDLEKLHKKHTEISFSQCDKLALVKGIWQNHSHNPMAVVLVANICQDFKIHNTQLWNSLLQKLNAFKLVDKLHSVLMYVHKVPELWHIPCLSKLWQEITVQPLTRANPPLCESKVQQCVGRALSLLIRCPVLESIDLGSILHQYCRLEMLIPALACTVLMTNEYASTAAQQQLFQRYGTLKLLQALSGAESLGMPAALLKQVTMLMFVHVETEECYDTILTCEGLRVDFACFLLDSYSVEGLAVHLLKNKRYTETLVLFDEICERQGYTLPEAESPEIRLQMCLAMVGLSHLSEEI